MKEQICSQTFNMILENKIYLQTNSIKHLFETKFDSVWFIEPVELCIKEPELKYVLNNTQDRIVNNFEDIVSSDIFSQTIRQAMNTNINRPKLD